MRFKGTFCHGKSTGRHLSLSIQPTSQLGYFQGGETIGGRTQSVALVLERKGSYRSNEQITSFGQLPKSSLSLQHQKKNPFKVEDYPFYSFQNESCQLRFLPHPLFLRIKKAGQKLGPISRLINCNTHVSVLWESKGFDWKVFSLGFRCSLLQILLSSLYTANS